MEALLGEQVPFLAQRGHERVAQQRRGEQAKRGRRARAQRPVEPAEREGAFDLGGLRGPVVTG